MKYADFETCFVKYMVFKIKILFYCCVVQLETKNVIDFYSKSYENIILICDFNAEISDSHMYSFSAIYYLKSLKV